MHIAKTTFSPCLFRMGIYLVDLWNYQGAEKFDILTETYLTLSVALPTSLSNNSSCALVEKEMVFINIEKQLHKWNLETGAVSSATFTGVLSGIHLVSNSPPVCLGEKVYFVHYETGKLYIYDLISSSLAIH